MTIDDPGAPLQEPVDGVSAPGDAEPQAADAASQAGDAASQEPVDAVSEPVDAVSQPGDAVSQAVRDGEAPSAGADPSTLDEAAPRLDPDQLASIVEALVFASPEPLSLKALGKLLADEPADAVAGAIQTLKAQYDRPGGLHIVEVAGGFQITTRPEFHEWVRRLFHERTTQKLSVQALETLAVVAYKQPITAAEIGEIRGVNTSGVLSTLLDRHLVKIVGRKNVIGRPFLYGTTREFLIRFGLKDVTDLPRVEDMAQALGFDAPAILRERSVPEEMLPLDDEAAEG